jgi:hypothetical protein
MGSREVYKDAFAPPATSRRVKPWERAPVPAHAPRLQGQKVWKKVGLKTHFKEDDKENCEAVQEELEKGGMGARKRARVRGGKENISDALWKAGMMDEEIMGNGAMVSPKKQRISMGPGNMDALVVPRKRTNANHLITPRKLGRKIPLMEEAQVTVATQTFQETLILSPAKLSPQKIPLDGQEIAQGSIKSPLQLSPQKIPLNDMDQNEDGVTVPAEKPVRRRKSLRRSTRRLTRGATPEQPPAAPAEEVLGNSASEPVAPVLETTTQPTSESEPLVLETASKVSESVGDVLDVGELLIAIPSQSADQSSGPEVVQELVALRAKKQSLPKSQHEAELSVEYPPTAPKALEEDLKKSLLMQPLDNLQAQASSSPEHLLNNAIEPATILEQPSTAANQTPKSKHPLLSSVEIGTETQFSSPTKRSGTPRQRRKTPQRRGSRRSTRSTRASSVLPEDQSAHDVAEIKNSHPTSSPVKARMAKTPTKKARKSTGQDLVVIEKLVSTEAHMNQNAESTTPASKQNVEIEAQAQQLESTDTKGIVTPRQPSESTFQSENVDPLEPVTENCSSGSPSAEAEGEDPILAMTATEEEISTAGIVNIQEDITFEVITVATEGLTEDEEISFPLKLSQPEELEHNLDTASEEVREGSVEALEVLEPISITLPTENPLESSIEEPADELPGSSTPNPSTTELVETISENALANTFDHDDTDMLRNFLTRVKANKAAKAGTSIPKRKRSLPHSPLRLPLGSVDSALSPSSPKSKDEFDVSLPTERAAKRKLDDAELGDDEATQPKSIRRSGRTRLPVKTAPLAAPSFIPVRRLGQDGDNTVTLRRNQEKELAALTRVNTRKNKGGAQLPIQVLAKQAEEKEDPASRQRALKEVFDEKALKQKGKKGKTVVWAEELAQFQTEEGKAVELDREPEKERERPVPVEEKKNAVKVGVRSKMTLGMAVNGTPAPKRKMRGRS